MEPASFIRHAGKPLSLRGVDQNLQGIGLTCLRWSVTAPYTTVPRIVLAPRRLWRQSAACQPAITSSNSRSMWLPKLTRVLCPFCI